MDSDWENDARFMSIDPGGHFMGAAVFSFAPDAVKPVLEHVATLHVDRYMTDMDDIIDIYGERVARLKTIERIVRDFVLAWKPLFVVSEAAHFNPRNFQAYASLTECTAMMRNAVMDYGNGIPYYTIEASVVKKAVGVSGNSGDKSKMAKAIVEKGIIDNADHLDEHSVDAIAIGYAKFNQLFNQSSPYERNRIDHSKNDRHKDTRRVRRRKKSR